MTITSQQPRTLRTHTGDHRFGVAVTHLTHTNYLYTLDYDYPIVILRHGATTHQIAPLIVALTIPQAHPWLCAWGVPDTAHPRWDDPNTRTNLWDYLNPHQVITPAVIRPQHRLPARLLAALT